MKLLFANGTGVDIVLRDVPITNSLLSIFKHLRHVDLDFRPWDNPYYRQVHSFDDLAAKLRNFGEKVGVQVKTESCHSQDYLNSLHQLYETNYDGRSTWLDFHEHIHLCEYKKIDSKLMVMFLDYREAAGPLEKKFDLTWLETGSTNLQIGDVYVEWTELGKTPYKYWKDQEPNDIDRLCMLAKPWLTLKPKLCVCLKDRDTLRNVDVLRFNHWWQQYHHDWCQHWQLESWTVQHMHTVAVFGQIQQTDILLDLLANNINPIKVTI